MHPRAKQHTTSHGHITSIDRAHHRSSPAVVIGVKRQSTGGDQAITAKSNRSKTNKYQASVIRRHGLEASADQATDQFAGPRSTPGPSQNPLLLLSHPAYGLPQQLVLNLQRLGVKSIYPWQASCLLGRGLLEGQRNLIYAAPTGGGKSLVADVLMLKRIIDSPGHKAILVLPYVALVQEKTRWLRRLVDDIPRSSHANDSCSLFQNQMDSIIRVAGMFGGSKSLVTFAQCDIAVCTIEKANMLINSAIEDGHIGDLGVVVFDELHMLDDEHRGYIMELMITKLLCLESNVQILGMSATLSNPQLLANWLQAKFYVSNYRPIPIDEYLVYNNAIYPTANSKVFLQTTSQLITPSSLRSLEPSHDISASAHPELSNPMINAVVALAVETAIAGYGALVFCGSRQAVQNVAALISDTMPSEIRPDVVDKRLDVLASLQALSGGFESTFSKTIPAGVGFHHAGLTTEEREYMAEAYDSGTLRVMVATCSLAAGINLPARRVILYGARMGRDLVGPAMLRQMRGRAGRKGKDEVGQTFLCCHKDDLQAVAELLEAELPPVVSCLVTGKRGLTRAILEVLAIRLASSYVSLQDYVHKSLLWQTTAHEIVVDMLDHALQWLVDNDLAEIQAENIYCATRIGVAVVASGFGPEDGLFVHSDLRKAISSFVMDSDLHLFYLFTPIPQSTGGLSMTSDISWPIFRSVIDSLDDSSLRALRLIGVSPTVVNSMAQSGRSDLKETTPQEYDTARIYRRVYSTLALRDICNEVPISVISTKYELPRGHIQSLAQTCHGFAAGMIKFCQRMSVTGVGQTTGRSGQPCFSTASATSIALAASKSSSSKPDPNASGFSMLGAVLEHMQDRLRAGARADLLDMAQVTFVKGRMARVLYENGFKGVRALAQADPKKDILPILMTLSGWKMRRSEKQQQQQQQEDDGDDDDHQLRKQKLEEKLLAKAEVLVSSANRVWERECLRQDQDFED